MSEQYPHGKISPDDEGNVKMAIAADKEHNVVRIIFQKELEWIALDVESAEAFVKVLEQKIDELKAGG